MSKQLNPELREKYKRIAKEEFLKKGYDRVSMKSISDKAGTSTCNIYTYFKSKNDIFNEIVENATLCINGAVDYPEEVALCIEKDLSESQTLIKKLSELQPEILISLT